jgi:hypothetical protein
MSDALVSTKARRLDRLSERQGRNWRWPRLVLLLIGALAMVTGLWTGLLRLGFALPGASVTAADLHGAFMIAGFLGTVISLERAVALGRGWGYAAPATSAVGALALLSGAPYSAALAFIVAGTILLVITVNLALHRRLELSVFVLALAVACWIIGTVLWLQGHQMASVIGWWLNFLVLTIAAERLELSRIAHLSQFDQIMFLVVAAMPLIGAARGELAGLTSPFTAVGLIGLGIWLLRHDIARRTVRHAGQPRFLACAVIAGQFWLAVAGILLLLAPPAGGGFIYDAVVHAIAIGFVISMIFGHAPIILPAVTGLHVRFHGAIYGALVLLHLSVAIRVAADLFALLDLRAASAIATIVALAAYAMTLAIASRRSAA